MARTFDLESGALAELDEGELPTSVRYVKNGPGGSWWKAALELGQIHGGWWEVPAGALQRCDLEAIKAANDQWRRDRGIRKAEAQRDLNALMTLLNRPSRHIWITFEQGRLWWCTVDDAVEAEDEKREGRGHFWLTCQRPWSDRSLNGERHLVISELPGAVVAVAGYRATVCEPGGSEQILRVIKNEEGAKIVKSRLAREAYCDTVADLLGELRARDFEVLVDLVLARDGWVRLGSIGGSMMDIDSEVQNRSADEVAFVQVKSRADQGVLDEYVARFMGQRDRYARMIFAVHTTTGPLRPPANLPVQVWDRGRLADLVVRTGLGEWVERRA